MARPMKRFYTTVSVDRADDGYRVLLDGRPLRTPAKAVLVLPTRAFAEAVAAEWAAQGDRVRPEAMALMGLACMAIDRIAAGSAEAGRAEVVRELAAFAETDMTCYRVVDPADLVAPQVAAWQPLLDWAALTLDAPLKTTTGILPVLQPESSLAALERAVAAHGDLALAALSAAVGASGSLIIGLALSHGRIDADAAFEAAELHETHQLEVWGEDPDTSRRRATVRADLAAAGRGFALLRDR